MIYFQSLNYSIFQSKKTKYLVTNTKKEIINQHINYCKKFGLDVSKEEEELPIMYWMPKIHKSPIGCRFIVASKKCSTKPLTKTVSHIFKMIFAHVENFNIKSSFFSLVFFFFIGYCHGNILFGITPPF